MKQQNLTQRQKWFNNRVGKMVWRNKTSCQCSICQNAYEEGLLIMDAAHASMLCNYEAEFNAEGYTLKYFDTRQERDAFESKLKKQQ